MNKQCRVCILELSSVLIVWLQSMINYDIYIVRPFLPAMMFLLSLKKLCNPKGILPETVTLHLTPKGE